MMVKHKHSEYQYKINAPLLFLSIVLVAIVFSFFFYILAGIKIDKLEDQIQELQGHKPEVINGNLYIGYEEGIRIGYLFFNNTWHRCVRDCEIILERGVINEN